MRKTFCEGVRSLFAVAVCLVVFLCVWLSNASALQMLSGTRTFYLYNASSQAFVKNQLTLADIFSVNGESVCIVLPDGADGEVYARMLVKALDMEIVFSETVGETLSLYGFSPRFLTSIQLYGKAVNAHLVVGNGVLIVGTPIIFGGY
jgi:hypothetical protein